MKLSTARGNKYLDTVFLIFNILPSAHINFSFSQIMSFAFLLINMRKTYLSISIKRYVLKNELDILGGKNDTDTTNNQR